MECWHSQIWMLPSRFSQMCQNVTVYHTVCHLSSLLHCHRGVYSSECKNAPVLVLFFAQASKTEDFGQFDGFLLSLCVFWWLNFMNLILGFLAYWQLIPHWKHSIIHHVPHWQIIWSLIGPRHGFRACHTCAFVTGGYKSAAVFRPRQLAKWTTNIASHWVTYIL